MNEPRRKMETTASQSSEGTALEIRNERDETIPLWPDQVAQHVLRIRYRPVGTRRWTTFLLVPEPGEDWPELEMKTAEAVAAHRRSRGSEGAR